MEITSTTLLQILLLMMVFFIGVLATIAVQHAYAHYRPEQHNDDGTKDGMGQSSGRSYGQSSAQSLQAAKDAVHLPAAVKERLLQQSQANFQKVLDKSAADLEHDLEKTAGELNRVLQKIGVEVVGNEMERYRIQLDQIRQQAASAIGSAQDEISQHQTELKAKLEQQHAELQAKLAEDIMTEKQRLVQEIMADKKHLLDQIDTKLSDAVASFLIETLGHNVDLGAQTAYLTALLEEHKDDFKREVSA